MAPLITLLLGTIAARGIGWLGWSGEGYVNSWTAALAVGLAAMVPNSRVSNGAI